MSNYIIIPRDAMRHALSDLLLNLTSIVTAVCCAERDIPMIQLCMGIDAPVKISFNNTETRDDFFQFILNESKPLSLALKTDEKVVSKTEKKRKETTRD